jgi:hypothetical protein
VAVTASTGPERKKYRTELRDLLKLTSAWMKIGHVEYVHIGFSAGERNGLGCGKMDFGIVRMNPSTKFTNRLPEPRHLAHFKVDFSCYPSGGTVDPAIGMEVIKYGRTTGYTSGTVTAVEIITTYAESATYEMDTWETMGQISL